MMMAIEIGFDAHPLWRGVTWMARLASTAAVTALAGCATGLSLTGEQGGVAGDGTLRLTLLKPYEAEVRVDGRRYVGPWPSELCTAETCGSVYQETPRLHRRHLRKGDAVLVAADGSRLQCDWISHLPDVTGTCRTGAGRSFKLVGSATAL
jgi:hypothetical protein